MQRLPDIRNHHSKKISTAISQGLSLVGRVLFGAQEPSQGVEEREKDLAGSACFPVPLRTLCITDPYEHHAPRARMTPN